MRIRGRGTREGQRAHPDRPRCLQLDRPAWTPRRHPDRAHQASSPLNARSHLPWRAPLNHEIRPGTRAHAPRRNATMTLYDPTRGIDKRDIDWGRHEPRVHRTAAWKHQMRGRVASSNAEHAISPLARCQYVTASSTSPSQPSSHRARAAIARHATSRPGRMGHDAIRGAPRPRVPTSAPGTPHRLPIPRRWRSTQTLQRPKNPSRPTQSPHLQAIPCVRNIRLHGQSHIPNRKTPYITTPGLHGSTVMDLVCANSKGAPYRLPQPPSPGATAHTASCNDRCAGSRPCAARDPPVAESPPACSAASTSTSTS